MWTGLQILEAFSRRQEVSVMRASLAALAISVFRHLITERIGAQVRHLAQKIDGRFWIAVLQLAVRWTHAAKRLDLAAVANRWPRPGLIAEFQQRTLPTFPEAAFSNVVTLLMRDDADTHRAVGVHGTSSEASAAGIFLLW